MIDPAILSALTIEERERIAYQAMSDAARFAADLLGPSHSRSQDLVEIAGLFDQRPSLRLLSPSGSPRQGPVRSPLLRLLG